MRLEPTPRAMHLGRSGLLLLAVGLLGLSPEPAAVGAALLFAVAVARAWAHLAVARARAAGFEMAWQTEPRLLAVPRLGHTQLRLELTNRDRVPLCFADLEVSHAPALEVVASPRGGRIAAGGRCTITLDVVPKRVGFHGIHGLVLRAVQAPGLFDVPLAFSSPVVLDVQPRIEPHRARAARRIARDGHAEAERHGPPPGDGSELRELREFQPGDPYKRIAWKASARRGRLLVAQTERERRESAWLLLDASLESAAGAPGEAALDRAIDDLARLARSHLARGDRIGLVVLGSREIHRVPLGRGPRHGGELLDALTHHTHCADGDRSEWDDADVTRRVLEHMRSLDQRAQRLSTSDTAGLVGLARQLLELAPARAAAPRASGPEQRLYRQYLLSFGIQPPPLGVFDRGRSERELGRTLRDLCAKKPRPSVIHVYSRAPSFETPRELFDALRDARRFRVGVRFHAVAPLPALGPDASTRQRIVHDALEARLHENDVWAARELRSRGVDYFAEPPR